MPRASTVFTLFLALSMLPAVCHAAEPKPPAAAAEKPAEPTETVIRLTVEPMAAPIPALKYQLLPEISEMNPGNPIQGYLDCFTFSNNFFFGKQAEADRDAWGKMPLKDLPLEQIGNYGGHTLRIADDAARLDTPNWQFLLRLRREGMFAICDDLPHVRLIAIALKVRFRAEIAGRHFDKAIITAKTMFAISRHMAEHSTIVGDYYGFYVVGLTLDPLEEMIQQPACPNLYWALSTLPTPLVGIDKGIQGERSMTAIEFASLDQNAPMSDAELQTLSKRLAVDAMGIAFGGGPKTGDIRKSLDAKAKNEEHLAAARKRLAEAGLDPDRLKKLPPLQVVLLDEVLWLKERSDDGAKAAMLPFWQMQSVLAADRQMQKNKADRDSLSAFFVLAEFARAAQVRLEQRIALLRCVEALRMYGADHEGRLPARLDDVPVRLPVDPVTGEPFSYRLNGATAIIRGTVVPRPATDTPQRETNVVEVTMTKSNPIPKEPRAK